MEQSISCKGKTTVKTIKALLSPGNVFDVRLQERGRGLIGGGVGLLERGLYRDGGGEGLFQIIYF